MFVIVYIAMPAMSVMEGSAQAASLEDSATGKYPLVNFSNCHIKWNM